jgi:thiamine biosynthesis lipoprotein
MTSLKQKLKRVRPLLGTFVEITLSARAEIPELQQWITAGFEAVAEIDRLMSRFRDDSDLSRLNRAAPHEWIPVHPHTLAVLKAANRLWRDSQEAFDIRCEVPVSGTPIQIRDTRVKKNGAWTYDLGGIAKGYAVDCAVRAIRRLASCRTSGVVNAGGDLRRWGSATTPISVATSTVRTPLSTERLTPAVHRQMPQGQVLTKPKTVSVLASRCLWSDALTKVLLSASQDVIDHCLRAYNAYGVVMP